MPDSTHSSDGLARQEFKYYVNSGGVAILRQSLKRVMKLDSHLTGKKKSYIVSSLYFDTPFSEDLNDKLSGISARTKYRLRIYNQTIDVIKFETKTKINNVIEKRSDQLSVLSAKSLIAGRYGELRVPKNYSLKRSLAEMTSRGYRPVGIVEYDREAYTLPYGNIRITFDLNSRTYNTHTDLFDLRRVSIPLFLNNVQVVEVKFSIPLPTFIKEILSSVSADRAAVSKYVLSQRYKANIFWSDMIYGR